MHFPAKIRRSAIVLTVVMIALSPVVGPVSAGLPASGDVDRTTDASAADLGGSLGPAEINASSDEVTAGSGNVSVWQRAPLALDTDELKYANGDDVDTYLDTPTVRATRGGETIEHPKDRVSFFEAGKEIESTLNPGHVGKAGALDGQKIQYVAIRLGDNDVPDVDSLDDVSSLLENDPDVTGRIIEEQTGADTVTFTPQESGQYALIAVAVDDDGGAGVSGPSESAGQLSVDSPVTVVGFDLFPVRMADDGATVYAHGRPAGENVSVKTNTSAAFAGKTVRHTVLVIDEDNFSSQNIEVVIENDSVSEISTTIGSTNGVTRIEPDISTIDVPLANLSINSTEELVAALENESENITVTTGDGVINASVTSVEAGPETTVDVGTKSDWPSGDYTYLYVATPTDGTETVARRGTVSIEDETEAYVTGFELSKDKAEPGEEITVNATIFNPDDIEDETVDLKVDGKVVDTKEVEDIPSNEFAYVEFSLSRDESGFYDVSVDNLPPKTLKVDEEAYVTDFELSSDRVGTDDPVTVTATVFNPGLAEDETVDFKVDGVVVETKRIEHIAGGAEATVEYTTSFSNEGTYDIGVDNLDNQTLEVDDEAYVKAFTVEPRSLRTGQSITVKATVVNPGTQAEEETVELKVDGTTVKTQTITVGEDAEKIETFTYRFNRAGEYNVWVDNLESESVDVRVRSRSNNDDDDEDDDDGDGPPGPDGDGPPGPDGEGPPGKQVKGDVTPRENGASVAVGQVNKNDEVTVDLGSNASENGVGLTGLSVRMNQSAEGQQINVTRPQSGPPADTPPVDETRDGARALSYFTVTPDVEDNSRYSGVNYTFAIGASSLPDGVSTDEVVLLRFSDGAWTQLPTEYLGNGSYRAQSPGFSAYAIGVRQAQPEPRFSIDETSINSRSLEVGEETTVTARISNDGNASGTFTANLSVDGQVIDSREVTIDAGETESAEFTVSFDEAGTYGVAINDEDVASVTVEDAQQATATPGDGGPSSTPIDEPSGVPLWLSLGLFALFVLIAGFAVYRVRTGPESDSEPLEEE